MRASRPKATQWSTAWMYPLTLLPSSHPARGMANWKAPNQTPIFTACFQPKPGMAMPLDTDTAKASRARLTAMRKISTTHITCANEKLATLKKYYSTPAPNML